MSPSLALAGCAVVGDRGPIVGVYAGLVALRASARPAGPVDRTDLSVLGLWLDTDNSAHGPAAGLGWRHTQRVAVASDCRLVIIVKSDEQLSAAQTFLSQMSEKERSCVVKP